MPKSAETLKTEILRLSREYSRQIHAANRPGTDPLRPPFAPENGVPYAGRVFDEEEVQAAVGAALDFWLTLGSQGEAFECELASFLGVRQSLLVNSGSSANLLAIATLTSHKLPANRRLSRGDEVVTVAAGFPTTIAPIVQNGAIPVFVDSDPVTGNVRIEQLEDAFAPGKTKAVIIAHTLGNPFDLAAVLQFCRERELWLIEDNCDALGSLYTMPANMARNLGLEHLLKIAGTGKHPLIRFTGTNGELLSAPTGAWGDLSTQSFYPPHHLTTGEGGALNIVSQAALKSYAESFRDWGRDCWCASGKDNTCGRRFEWRLGELPAGYDHKYIYSHLGYNLKPLDLQAAIGRAQLKKLPDFVAARRSNWQVLREGLADLSEFIEFSLPTHASTWKQAAVAEEAFGWADPRFRSAPSWFGFMLRVRPEAPFTRTDLARHLDKKKIGNRMLFGGNLVRQPALVQLRRSDPNAMRSIGNLSGADTIMQSALFVGTYPGLSGAMIEYMIDSIRSYVASRLA